MSYDEGGLLPGGTVNLPGSTLRGVIWWTPEQLAAYERARVLVERWEERDAKPETTHG